MTKADLKETNVVVIELNHLRAKKKYRNNVGLVRKLNMVPKKVLR